MTKTIFLQKDTNCAVALSSNIDIILSPEFYWVRLFDIPIASKKEALGVVPNLFEDFFDIEGYKFYIIKLEEYKYLCFAYKEQDVLDGLKSANIDFKKVNNIYFAQNEFIGKIDDKAILMDENKFIYQDDVFIKIPSTLGLIIESVDFDISNIVLSKHKISINQSSKYIDTSSAYILSSIFIVFSLVIFFKTYTINKITNQYPIKIEQLKKDYHLMSSMIQTKSLLKQYQKVSKKYENTRGVLQYLINFKQKTSGKLESIEFKNGVMYGYFTNSNLNNMKIYIEKRYKISSSSFKNGIVKIGIKI